MPAIVSLQPAHIPQLYRIYRAQTDGLPHCLVPSEARFAADLGRLEAGELLVAEERGSVLGFAALRPVTDDQDTEADAITALFFADEAAGTLLVAECVRRVPSGALLAFPQSHGNAPVQGYNAGWDGLSDRMPAQPRLLARHGFAPYYRELLLACELVDELPAPPELPGMRLLGEPRESGGFRQRAWVGEERIGLCIYSLVADRADDPRGARTGSIDWLGTEAHVRRRGVARTLLLRALAHLRLLGCEQCWLTTGADNWPAQALYLSLGFVVVDSAASFVRHGRSSQRLKDER
jgi:ribosomal protein S18 acetylase RimI-like enzyme